MNFTFVIVSFKSSHLIENHIESIENKNQIIIIENSLDRNLKEKLERLYKNVEVIIPETNLGYGKGLNLGIQKSKNNFVICMVADLNIEKKCFIEIGKIVLEFKNFSILSPTYSNEKVYKNYEIFNKKSKKYDDFKVLDYKLREVDEIDGAILIINKEKIDSPYLMDENIFLYFESTDLCYRLRKNNKKLYIIENLKFEHFGLKSSHEDFTQQVLECRSWHYCWSKFYYYKKHHNYLFALRKTLPNFFRSIKMCIYFKFKNDKNKLKLHKSELSGLLNAYLLKSSFYRPKVN